MYKMKIPYRLRKFIQEISTASDDELMRLTGKKRYQIERIFKNKLRRIIKRKSDNRYLFILSPPFCGSTLLNEILSTSNAVSVNNPRFQREGQKLPRVRDIMFTEARWDENVDYDWNFIKKEWRKYWDITKPVLLEKSPSNIVRARSIEKHFQPSYFIVWSRNPYAHCESLLRREGAKYNAITAAEFAIKCLQHQRDNSESLRNVLRISYEMLTDNTSQFLDDVIAFMPELKDINTSKKFNAHNFKSKKMEIRSLNQEKISKLTSSEFNEINEVFSENLQVLNYFNYSLIK